MKFCFFFLFPELKDKKGLNIENIVPNSPASSLEFCRSIPDCWRWARRLGKTKYLFTSHGDRHIGKIDETSSFFIKDACRIYIWMFMGKFLI